MTMKPKTIEERVLDLEREVAVLKAAVRSPTTAGAGPGFAEEGQPPVLGGDAAEVPSSKLSLEARVARLENEVAGMKGQLSVKNPANAWILDELGAFENNPGFEEAVRLGHAYRRRQPKC